MRKNEFARTNANSSRLCGIPTPSFSARESPVNFLCGGGRRAQFGSEVFLSSASCDQVDSNPIPRGPHIVTNLALYHYHTNALSRVHPKPKKLKIEKSPTVLRTTTKCKFSLAFCYDINGQIGATRSLQRDDLIRDATEWTVTDMEGVPTSRKDADRQLTTMSPSKMTPKRRPDDTRFLSSTNVFDQTDCGSATAWQSLIRAGTLTPTRQATVSNYPRRLVTFGSPQHKHSPVSPSGTRRLKVVDRKEHERLRLKPTSTKAKRLRRKLFTDTGYPVTPICLALPSATYFDSSGKAQFPTLFGIFGSYYVSAAVPCINCELHTTSSLISVSFAAKLTYVPTYISTTTTGTTKRQMVSGIPKKMNIIADNRIISWKVTSLNSIPQNVAPREDITLSLINFVQPVSSPGLKARTITIMVECILPP
ncbi:hypothetical protein DBV15_05246 [Temnothorax longispinosus]|uniref:Uncharacterized protein n=1 Tax=Temnothorax longispinosus TaxID=300112 RepID=A0A4S2KLF7_9HYME|nr:hypothetical protein DBV15_05246 [Temnothorax longispinosus]